jgi:phosphatidylglycerol lysyltransferase
VLRLLLLAAVLAGSGWYLAERLQGFDVGAVLAALTALTPGRIGLALGAVALAFVAVAGQERAIAAHLALRLNPWRAGRAAAASAALSQALGFGPVLGALFRRRLLPEITLVQSFAISAGITLGFFGGLALCVLAAWAAVPGAAHRGWAAAGLAVGLAMLAALALSRQPMGLGMRKPNLFILARFLAWLALDLAALATAFWAMLPADQAPGLPTLLPVFLLALGLGIASGSPGGIGPFEAALLAWLPGVSAPGLLAAILAFRALAHLVPAACGLAWTLAARRGGEGVPIGSAEVTRLGPEALAALPLAEAGLIRQGSLSLLPLSGGGLWLTGRLAHARVMLGGPMAGARGGLDSALAEVEARARTEARLLCLYKIDARLAAAARLRGHLVLPVAREAVLDPGGFRLAGPARARLRRKLAHASKAGVVTEDCPAPPLAEMEAVAMAWTAAHGSERGFSLGRWERSYAAGQRVFAARDAAGRLLAFVTFHTCRRQWVLDLVRFRPEAPDGTIYALITRALEAARWAEVAELSLAAVPAPRLGLGGWRGAAAGHFTKGALGLEQFKSTFAPRWRPLYIAAPGPLALLFGGIELARAILLPAPLMRGRKAMVVFAHPSRHALPETASEVAVAAEAATGRAA